MQHLLLTFLLLIFTGMTTAQNRTVTGVISDPDGPIGGVIITVKGTERYSTTNFDGFYSIMVNDGDVLVFSYVGYESQEIVVGYQNKINVSLEPSLTICWFPYKILLPYINWDVLKLGYGVNYSTALIQIDKKLPHDIRITITAGHDFETNRYFETAVGRSFQIFETYKFIGLETELYSINNSSWNKSNLVIETINIPVGRFMHSLFIKPAHLYYQDPNKSFNEIGIGATVTSNLALGISHRTSFDYFKSVNVFSTRLTKDFYIGNRQFNTSINYQHLERFEEFTIGLGYHF